MNRYQATQKRKQAYLARGICIYCNKPLHKDMCLRQSKALARKISKSIN